MSGNMVFADASGGDMARNYAKNQNVHHNTFVGGSSGAAVVMGDSSAAPNQHFNNNIVIHKSGNSGQLVNTLTPNSQILSMDNNWYGLTTGKTITDGQSLTQRQSSTSFDQNSGEGAIAEFTMPTRSAYPNPNSWRDAAFLDDITPSAGWSGCNGSNTPGARSCSGDYLGWELQAISGAPNGGCGWAGLPIVGVKIAELGITGQCAPTSNGTGPPRPRPPELISAN